MLTLLLLACTPEPVDTADTGDTAVAEEDTASDTDTASGDTDTASGDTAGACADPSGTVAVTFDVWTPESGCWATVTEERDAAYWASYADDRTWDCDDITWVGGDAAGRCLAFSHACTHCPGAPYGDPTMATTPEADATCAELQASAPRCEG